MALYDPDKVVLQAATTFPSLAEIEQLLTGALAIVHAGRSEYSIGVAESAFGWTFCTLSVDISVIKRLVSLPGSSLSKLKGDSLGQKFSGWLNVQAKERGFSEKIHFTLTSDLHSSQYGFF